MTTAEQKISMLSKVSIFAHTPPEVIATLAEALEYEEISEGLDVVVKGDMGTCMYIIVEGSARVHDEDHTLTELVAGDLFGELALLDAEPRSATVTASTNCRLYRLSQGSFYANVAHRPEVLKGVIRMLVQRMRVQNDTIIDALKEREKKLERLVEERTTELKESYEEIKGKNEEILTKQVELENAYDELNAILEQLNARNVELQQNKKQLEESLERIKDQQDQLAQSEKMAAIGMIAHIVAHEINTPLGALTGVIHNMQELIPRVIKQLPESKDAIPADLQDKFWSVIEIALTEPRTISTKEERKYIRQFEQKLEDAGMEEAEEFAEKLVKIGLVDDLDSFLPLIRDVENSSFVMDTAYMIGMMHKHVNSMLSAISRAQKIVTTLKRYVSKRTESDLPIQTDVEESLDIVLTLYEYYFRQGVRIEQEYERVPFIMGFPEELVQVWTNILMNALYSVKNIEGEAYATINIRLQLTDNQVVVEVTDNGPGIAPDECDDVFNAGFTSRHFKQTTSFSLSVARDIVLRHKGTIEFDSEPGRTTFTVSFPATDAYPAEASSETD